MKMSKKGVYFSANDNVLPWVIAFLRSFRAYNPELKLYLIPFDSNCNQILGLASEFDFSVYEDDAFSELEDLGRKFELGHTEYGPYWFRRYASFWGPLDHFIYSDSRSIVLSDLNPVLDQLNENDFIYYDQAIDQVYNPGNFRSQLVKNGKAKGFLSGFWASKKDLFSKQELLKLGDEAVSKFRDDLNSRNTDQAFINYCFDHKKNLTSTKLSELLESVVHTSWAGQRGSVYKKENDYYLWDYGGLDHKKRVIYLHWAGYHWNDLIPQRHILNYFKAPALSVRFKRVVNGLKKWIKSRFWLRRLLNNL